MGTTLKIENTIHEDLKVWRYMHLAKFISMLERKALWLARADSFRDSQEGRFPDDMRTRVHQAYKGFSDSDPSPVKDADDFQDYLVKNTFISCWHKNLEENMVMWEIYGQANNAVAVQSSIGHMKRSLDPSSINGYSLLLRNVIYRNADEETGDLQYEECFFRKRRHFSFEEEVRISLDTYSRTSPTKKTPQGVDLPFFDVNELVVSVIVHPDSKKWFVDVVKSIAAKYGVHAPVKPGLYGME
ncbi:hypothetical protein ACXX82_24120 [Glaciimonas sp. GNP009]